LLAILALVVLACIGGAVTYVFLQSGASDRQPTGAEAVPRDSQGGPADGDTDSRAPTDSVKPTCDRRTAEAELRQRGQLDRQNFSGVARLICRDFTADGVQDMAFSRASTGSAGPVGWGVFVADSGGWTLPLFREDEGSVGIKADGDDILRSLPVRLPDDPNCCPTGGATVARFNFRRDEFLKVGEETRKGEGFPPGFYEIP